METETTFSVVHSVLSDQCFSWMESHGFTTRIGRGLDKYHHFISLHGYCIWLLYGYCIVTDSFFFLDRLMRTTLELFMSLELNTLQCHKLMMMSDKKKNGCGWVYVYMDSFNTVC